METTEKSTEVLSDLIEINNDRAAGFEKAGKELNQNDMDLQGIFLDAAHQSRQFSRELAKAIYNIGGQVESGHSASGTLHRAWMDVKATFSGNDRKSVLTECERGEDAIKKVYRDALSTENDLDAQVIALITRQQASINTSHDRIKSLRDSAS